MTKHRAPWHAMIMILGYGRSGKDTFAEMLRAEMQGRTGRPVKFTSSSLFACKRAVLPVLGPKYGYTTVDEAFSDRMAHRKEWADLITEYNSRDLARLGSEMAEAGMSLYVGCRKLAEVNALYWRGIAGPWIWVDRPGIEPERESMDFGVCEFASQAPAGSRIVLNAHGLDYLRTQASMAAEDLLQSGWVPR